MSRAIALSTLLLVALLAAAPLWGVTPSGLEGPGMVNTRGGGDSPFLLQRTHQMAVNLRAGVFPVRWMPDAAYGLGYPFFNYYAALPYYLAAGLTLIGVDILTALKLTQTLGFIAAALAMYGWMRTLTKGRWTAWLAAVAYTVAPFHLVNVYVRGDSLSEFYAFAFYPLILWAVQRIAASADRSTRMPILVASLAYTGLLLTHNISAFIFSPFILLYLMALAWRAEGGRWRILGLGLLALGIGFLLSAWFWLPAVAELKYVQLGPSTQDYFHYSRHFRTANLVQNRFLFDYSVAAGHKVRSPFAMGLAQALLAGLGGLVLLVRGVVRRRLEIRWGFILLGLLLSTLMITPLSHLLWDHLPLLPVVQFPWRFLSVQALFAAAATAALVSSPPPSPSRIWHPTLPLLIAALLTGSTLLSLHPDWLPIRPADVTVERLQLYELFTGNIGTTIRYEWLPHTADPRPYTADPLLQPDAPPRAIPLSGASLQAVLVARGPTRQTWRVWGEGGGIAFPLLHWPGWQAQVDGAPTAVWPVTGSGRLALTLPPGEHTVRLQLGRTPVRAAAEGVSLATTLMTTLVALGIAVSALLARPRPHLTRSSLGYPLLAILTVTITIIILLTRQPSQNTEDQNLTMDFTQMPYLHPNPDGVDVGPARLTGYTLSAEELAPGAPLTVTLNWTEVPGPYTATLRLVSPAAVRHPELEPLAQAPVPLSPSLPVSLSLPQDIPRGIYLLHLGETYLRPVRVFPGPPLPTDAAVLAAFGPSIRLHTASIAPSQSEPRHLAVRLAWSTAEPLAADYAISLRLLDGAGQVRAQMDTQPGYGFLPTSTWRPGELITDPYLLPRPEDLAPGSDYHLEIVLYQAPTLEPIGQARLGPWAWPLTTEFEAQPPSRSFTLPDLSHPLVIDFGEIRLAGYDLTQTSDALHVTLWWQARQAPQADYTVFVHLFDSPTEPPLVQSDAQPRSGAYPTSWWAEGEVVSETVTLPVLDVPGGTYRLAVGLYDQTMTRLAALDAAGERIPDDRPVLPVEVRIE